MSQAACGNHFATSCQQCPHSQPATSSAPIPAGGFGSAYCNGECNWDASTPSGTEWPATTGTCRPSSWFARTTTPPLSPLSTTTTTPPLSPLSTTPIPSSPTVAPEEVQYETAEASASTGQIEHAPVAEVVASSLTVAVGTVLAATVSSTVISSLGVALSTSSTQSAVASSSGGGGAALSLIYNVSGCE